MKPNKWKDPGRRRRLDISHDDPEYVKYYDLDREDFSRLAVKSGKGEALTYDEDNRYGLYILTIIEIVVNGPYFKGNSPETKCELRDQMYYELCLGLPSFNPDKGKIYSYAYRIAYTAGTHWFTDRKTREEHDEIIKEHIYEELMEYFDDINDHKVRTTNHE